MCCKLPKRGPGFQNLAWISTSQRAGLIDSVVIVQLLPRSLLQSWHVVPASDFDYFWTKRRACLELGFYFMSLLSNISQMLSPGENTFQGAQTLLKPNSFLSLGLPSSASPGPQQHWELLAAGQELPAAHSSSIALNGAIPDPIPVLFYPCHPEKPEPSAADSAQLSRGCRQASQIGHIWWQKGPRDCEPLCNPTEGLWPS